MNPQITIRNALLQYPGLFPCPLAVIINLFTSIGHGYDWNKKGELVAYYGPKKPIAKMDYSDLDERAEWERVDGEKYGLSTDSLGLTFKMELESDYTARRFVEANIDDITNAKCTLRLHGWKPRRYGFLDRVSLDHARAFNFPDHITKEWAKALRELFDYWQVEMNQEFGCSSPDKEYWKKWPEHAIKVREAIATSLQRLKPVIYGPDWKEREARQNEMITQIIDELKREDA